MCKETLFINVWENIKFKKVLTLFIIRKYVIYYLLMYFLVYILLISYLIFNSLCVFSNNLSLSESMDWNSILLESDFYYQRMDSHRDFNHAPLDLPWPASEKMNALVILYLEVSYTVLFIFYIVSAVLLETLILFSSEDHKLSDSKMYTDDEIDLNKEEIPFFNTYPIHFTPEEEHLIDIFVIIIPTIIVLQIIVPTLGYLYNEEMLYYDSSISFDVNIIGCQWYWTYEYIIDICNSCEIMDWNTEYNFIEKEQFFISYDSVLKHDYKKYRLLEVDNSLVLPINTNVLLSFTSRDVIHSWALPQMGIKVDCVPGRVTHTLFSSFALGVYYGQCSELCGPLHGFMPICVEVVSFDDFFIWIMFKYYLLCKESDLDITLIYTNEFLSVLNIKDNKDLSKVLFK